MPFIAKWRRNTIEACGLEGLSEIAPGDRCYVFYKQMVDKWTESPRWTTVHELVKSIFADTPSLSDDDRVARGLAWTVFFQLHVMPYELEKRKENGDI